MNAVSCVRRDAEFCKELPWHSDAVSAAEYQMAHTCATCCSTHEQVQRVGPPCDRKDVSQRPCPPAKPTPDYCARDADHGLQHKTLIVAHAAAHVHPCESSAGAAIIPMNDPE